MPPTSGSAVQIAAADDERSPHGITRDVVPATDFRMDGWLVQPSLNRLTRDGVVVRLRPQLMDLLVCLASRPGAVLGRDELMASVWDGRWVVESAVSRCVAELRAVFADSVHRPRIIETISKRGYRLIASVEPVPESRAEATAPSGAAGIGAAYGARSLRGWLATFLRRWNIHVRVIDNGSGDRR